MKNYILQDKVYIDPDNQKSFNYSDGDLTENYILQTVTDATDLSTGSEELLAAIKDWPSLYHLHHKRANLLRPLADLLQRRSILEIGCGCGAITRYLGELDARVTALEGSYKRACITAERGRDLPNIKVVCDNFLHFSSSEKFDVVTLVGVLEYANLFIPGENPFRAMLEKARTFLQPGGLLLIAIENKLGLKYWAGAPEDHTGQPYFGLEDRYSSSTAATFGKFELQELLDQSGFGWNTFLYPFPDYKLPNTVITEKGMLETDFDASMLLLENFEYVQSDYYSSHFSTTLAGGEIEKNRLLPDLSNSFLVIASPEARAEVLSGDLLAVNYNSQRKKEYQKTNTFLLMQGQGIQVRKQKAYDLLPDPSAPVGNLIADEPYFRGPLLLREAIKIISRKEWTVGELLAWAKKYYEILRGLAFEENGLYRLEGKYLDLTPFNIIINDQEEPRIFDQEWISPVSVPLGYLLFRGLNYSLGSISFFNIPSGNTPLDILELSIELYKNFLPFEQDDLEQYRAIELSYFSGVGLGKYIPFTSAPLKIRQEARLEQQLRKLERQSESQQHEIELQRREIAGLQGELANIISDIISEQARKIHGMYQQIDTLNINLSEIYASEGWKLLSVFYRFRNKILPRGSSRHEKVKKIVNWARRKKSDQVVIKDYSATGGELSGPDQTKEPLQFTPFEFQYFSHPKVSIIIPAYNGWEMNYLCLRSIRENTEGLGYEVIFADDVSTDETQHVEKYIKNIVHIRNEQNLGFLRNCNHAAGFARGEYLHFLNNDTRVTPGWLSSLVTLMDKDSTIGMAGSKLVYPDGRLQEAGGIIWQDGSGWNYGHKEDPDHPLFNYVKEVDYISGASVMIRNKLWKELGGFDTLFSPAYFEDTDLAFEVRKRGYKVMYQPLSKVLHYEGFSHGAENNGQIKEGSIKNYQILNKPKFIEKWKDVLEKDHFANAENVFWARDKSQGKKTIVVIDHYIPQFDKDAGSRTVFQCLSLFADMGFNVKFIGDNFCRHEPYTTIIQQKGIEVLYGDYYAENYMKWLTDNESYIDYVFLNRPHISIKYIDRIRSRMHAKIFYYMHDLHFIREMKEYEMTKQEDKLSSSARWKQIEYALFSNSDIVLTPSIKEEEIIRADFPDKPIRVMPAFFYPSIGDPIRDFNERRDILFIGGFAHDPNLDAILWFAGEVFPRIRKQNKELRLIIVGSLMPEKVTRLASEHIVVKGAVSDEELENIYSGIRLSVIPLRYGAGVKGKTVEALSKALPIVSTSFGIEGLKDIDDLLTAHDTADAFAEAVTKLYNDTGKLEEFSAAASAYAQKHFTIASAKKFFMNLFHPD